MALGSETDAPGGVAAATLPRKMTYEEFLAWADEDTHAEWVEGEVIELSPETEWHQDLGDFLTSLFRHFVEGRQLGKVLSAPFQMKAAPDLPGREPDILFIAQAHEDGIYRSIVLDGLWLKVDWLWQKPLPPLLSVLKEWGLI